MVAAVLYLLTDVLNLVFRINGHDLQTKIKMPKNKNAMLVFIYSMTFSGLCNHL